MQHTERQTMFTIWRRIMPLLIPVVFFAYLDRVNLGFAALAMNQDLGLTNTQFGIAAGFFAVGYAVAGIQSTLMLHRVGAPGPGDPSLQHQWESRGT
jgi:ACS family tartrate transporter-like MFS transporter